GLSAGTANAEMPCAPASPVRAMTTSTSVAPAPEMNAFEPLIRYASPSRRAVVLMLAASEPAPGSVRQYEASLVPCASAGHQRSTVAGVPQVAIIQVAML